MKTAISLLLVLSLLVASSPASANGLAIDTRPWPWQAGTIMGFPLASRSIQQRWCREHGHAWSGDRSSPGTCILVAGDVHGEFEVNAPSEPGYVSFTYDPTVQAAPKGIEGWHRIAREYRASLGRPSAGWGDDALSMDCESGENCGVRWIVTARDGLMMFLTVSVVDQEVSVSVTAPR